MSLFHLAYVSSAQTPFSDADLLDLLEVSRRNNAREGLTGMLLFRDGNFIQVLEGAEEAVRRVHHRIVQDPRHGGCITLLQGAIASRSFAEWSMGFRNLNDPQVRATPGFSEFLNTTISAESFSSKPSRALQLLQTFRRSVR